MPEAAHREAPPARACHQCGARQDECQEICVECGAAVPRARGARLRAVKPLALAAFAVLVVTSAAYGVTANAGLDESAVKQAVAAAPQSPAAPPAQPPPAPATPTPPPTTPAAPAPPANPSPPPAKPAPTPAPTPAPASPAPAAPSNPSPSPAHHSSGGSSSGSSHARPSTPTSKPPSWLSSGDQPYSATLSDPYANGADEHASAAPKAVDGKASTAWTTADHPGGLGKPGVGLVIEASGYQSYSALGIQTATPGMSVSIYSTDASDPPQAAPDQAGSGWKLEATKSSVAKQQRIALKGATANPHYLVVWIKKLPPGKSKAGLSEISLLP